MSQKILQVNYNFSMSRAEFEQAFLPAAKMIADTPGLRWKVWLMDEANKAGGGIHLFDDEAALQTYLAGVKSMLGSDPHFSNLDAKVFDVVEAHTAITRGPVGAAAPSANGKVTTFGGSAEMAYRAVPTVKPADAFRRQKSEPNLLVIDVRDAADIAQTGTVPGAANISYGTLTYAADTEVPESWRDPRLADRSRPIITTCILGPLGALGGKLLHDMGYTNVQILDGGVAAWQQAGLPVSGIDGKN